MKSLVYVISDIHGQLDLFQQLLRDFDPMLHQLVLIGDLNDRGPRSKECLLLGMELVQKQGCIYLLGNHEQYLLQFLQDPEEIAERYWLNGGKETVNSLLHLGATQEYSPTEIALMIRSRYKELIQFLTDLPYYYEWEKYVFVHAGIDLTKADWHQTSLRDFIWIREPFLNGKNHTGKVIVFGHTITSSLHGDGQTTDLWFSDDKIGIDGGAIFGGSVHGVIFNPESLIQDIEYQNMKGPWKPDF